MTYYVRFTFTEFRNDRNVDNFEFLYVEILKDRIPTSQKKLCLRRRCATTSSLSFFKKEVATIL